MEEEIDIYADLPNFDLNSKKNDETCNCEDMKKKLNSLTSRFENIKKINKNLKKNLSSLLKTAKAEITRKEKMIADLRNQLDNITFKRNIKAPLNVSAHKVQHQHIQVTEEKYEDVTFLAYLNENEDENEFESYHNKIYNEHKSKKPQNDIDQTPVTIFGERLHKRIIDEEKRKEKQRALLKVNSETNAEMPKKFVKSDKDNKSQSNIINNIANISIVITQNSETEIPLQKNSGKRLNEEEDDMCKSKRIKIDNEENKTTKDNINCIVQYNMKDNFVKLEDQLNTVHTVKSEQVLFDTKYKVPSEHKDTKQDQNCTMGRIKSEKNENLVKNHGESRTRKELVNCSRNSRSSSMSNERFNTNYQNDHYINDHKKSSYRCSSPNFRNSKNSTRSHYESSSNYRLREKSSRTYKDKYTNYKYNSRYKDDRIRRDYDSKEDDNNRRKYSREREDVRDRFRHPSNDIDDKTGKNNLDKNNRSNSRGAKSNENNKITTDFSTTNGAVVNIKTSCNVEESIKEHDVRNKSYSISKNSTKNVLRDIVANDTCDLEDGEILDSDSSPEKKNNFTNISKNKVTKRNVTKMFSAEDKNRNTSVNLFRCKKSVFSQDKVNISTKKTEAALQLRANLTNTDNGKITLINSISDNIATTQNLTTGEQVRDTNIEDKNRIDESLQNSIENVIKFEEVNNCNNKNTINSEKISSSNAENAAKIDETNNFHSDNVRRIDGADAAKDAAKYGIESNCDTEDHANKSRTSVESKMSDKNNSQMSHLCLNDHDYVRDVTIGTVEKVHVNLECRIADSETVTSEKTKMEETVSVRSVGIRKISSAATKNKKEQKQSKTIVVSRRQKAVILSDSTASMTVVKNTNTENVRPVNSVNNNNDCASKLRISKSARVKVPCK